MPNASSFSLIIPAAGIGSRMQSELPKQYLKIGQQTLMEHVINAFIARDDVRAIVVCVSPKDESFASLKITQHSKIHSCIGGDDRAHSVLNGLRYLRDELNLDTQHPVMVHDAARPGISQGALERLKACFANAQANNTASGAILALPVVDTVKKVQPASTPDEPISILATLDRNSLYQAQTPQMFLAGELQSALISAFEQGEGHTITDEASAMERLGKQVLVAEGEARNFKVTRPEDLSLAAYYLSSQYLSSQP